LWKYVQGGPRGGPGKIAERGKASIKEQRNREGRSMNRSVRERAGQISRLQVNLLHIVTNKQEAEKDLQLCRRFRQGSRTENLQSGSKRNLLLKAGPLLLDGETQFQ